MPGFSIVGSSPEILVRLRDGKVTIRPIAGTRPRGKTPAEDKALAEELMADPKERAEHLMLVDLGRNDVGRVAKIGGVKVTGSFFIERYSHVMHLVSNVEGDIRGGLDCVDALAAGLPAGTLSGAPKIRAMEIIDEFEKEKRGPYGGAVGYFGADGNMDTCIVLRTALVKDGTMYVQAGGGVVADSEPEAEYQETVNKARALMAAAEEAVCFRTAACSSTGSCRTASPFRATFWEPDWRAGASPPPAISTATGSPTYSSRIMVFSSHGTWPAASWEEAPSSARRRDGRRWARAISTATARRM